MELNPEPIFVLCGARTGSTLLRFVLDAHPDLACPPETNIPAMCAQIATVASLVEGAPLSQNRGDEPPEIPDAAIDQVRAAVERMTRAYLQRKGKKRFCDKSLGTARFAYLMQRIWPRTKFICVVRHGMDMIVSGREACPWGLNGYGFDPYGAATPGNSVHALAHYWVDSVATILQAREQYPELCHLVRYEDLVADPQGVADELFKFLGVDPVPGIAAACFSPERERFGPADYKIWHTSEISADSVGRGWTLPAGLIGAPVRAAMNELLEKLGYVPVDDNWGTADRPADLRVRQQPESAAAAQGAEGDDSGAEQAGAAPQVVLVPPAPAGAAPDPGFAGALPDRLQAGLARLSDDFGRRWDRYSTEMFDVVAESPDQPGQHIRWRVDLAARTVSAASPAGAVGQDAEEDDDTDSAWDILGPADVWEKLISGQENMSVALRRHELRYQDSGDSGPVALDTRIGMLSDLLGLASWGQARTDPKSAETRADGADAA